MQSQASDIISPVVYPVILLEYEQWDEKTAALSTAVI